MTIAGMLRKHGHDTPRYVDGSGRVRFKTGTTATVSGLAVTPHTFHGGKQHTPPSGASGKWWETPGIIERDREEMRAHFPSFYEVPADDECPPAWAGVIDTGRGKFPVIICHRTDLSLPSVVPAVPNQRQRREGRHVRKSPHLYLNGNLCVAAAEDWNPERDSIATVVAWAAHWHACYVDWLTSGQWPTEGIGARAA